MHILNKRGVYVILFGGMLAALFAGGALPAVAQEASVDAVSTSVDAAALDAEESRILPGNPLYLFKQIGRSINIGLTFNPVKKAEKRLTYANTKLVEARQLAQMRDDTKAQEALRETLTSFNRDMEKIAESADTIRVRADGDAPRVDAFLNRMADRHVKQHKILAEVEATVPEEARVEIDAARREAAQHFAAAMERAESARERTAARIARAFEQQRDHAFSDMRHLEIMESMDDVMPPELLSEMKPMRDELKQRAVRVMRERADLMQRYVEEAHGDDIDRLRVFDALRTELAGSTDALEEIDALREQMAERFANRMERATSEQMKERIMERFTDGNPENMKSLKFIEKVASTALAEDLKKADLKATERFKERFREDPNAMRSAKMFERCRANPDSDCMAVLSDLEQSLTDEQKKFIAGIQAETQIRFRERFEQEGDRFLEQFVDPNPRSLERLQELRKTLPPEALPAIEQAIEVQALRLNRHIERIDDPAVFERYRATLEEQDHIRRAVDARAGDVLEKLRAQEERVLRTFNEQQGEMRERFIDELEQSDVRDGNRDPERIRRAVESNQTDDAALRELSPEERIRVKRFIEQHDRPLPPLVEHGRPLPLPLPFEPDNALDASRVVDPLPDDLRDAIRRERKQAEERARAAERRTQELDATRTPSRTDSTTPRPSADQTRPTPVTAPASPRR